MVQYSKDRASRRGHRHRHRRLGAAHHRRGRARVFAHPFPKPSVHSTLRSGGAYRLVRHPIYGGLLLLAIGVVLGAVTHRARGDRASRRGPRAEGPARGVDVGGALSRVRGVSAARSMAFRPRGSLNRLWASHRGDPVGDCPVGVHPATKARRMFGTLNERRAGLRRYQRLRWTPPMRGLFAP